MFSGRFVFSGDFSSSIERRNIFWLLKKTKFEITSKKTTKNEYFCLTRWWFLRDFEHFFRVFVFSEDVFIHEYNKEAQSRLLIDFPYLLFVISFVHMKLCLICCCLPFLTVLSFSSLLENWTRWSWDLITDFLSVNLDDKFCTHAVLIIWAFIKTPTSY